MRDAAIFNDVEVNVTCNYLLHISMHVQMSSLPYRVIRDSIILSACLLITVKRVGGRYIVFIFRFYGKISMFQLFIISLHYVCMHACTRSHAVIKSIIFFVFGVVVGNNVLN